MDKLIEELTQAEHNIGFTLSDLRASLKTASPVEAMVILPVIKNAAEVENGIRALIFALDAVEA